MFYHSILSDWNHGNAHFLRGIVSELRARGHDVVVFEPQDSWSLRNLLQEQRRLPIKELHNIYPGLKVRRYDLHQLDLDRVLDGADLVIVHEWNEPELIARIGRHRAWMAGRYALLFHDTHHRAVTAPQEMAAYDLTHYDGVLAFGEALREVYLRRGWTRRAWTWHEAADTRVFRPQPSDPQGDLIWIGNWGDEERTTELREFLLEPVKALGLRARVHGVRYPEEGKAALAEAGIEYLGWLPNYRVPWAFAQFRATIHVPRRPYVQALPGIPTIRVFEALACGIPLVCSPWEDAEGLFRPGEDYLLARTGQEMQRLLRDVLCDHQLAQSLVRHGLQTIRERHTCVHRVDELLAIHAELQAQPAMAHGHST